MSHFRSCQVAVTGHEPEGLSVRVYERMFLMTVRWPTSLYMEIMWQHCRTQIFMW